MASMFKPKMPAVQPTQRMPDPEGKEAVEARKKRVATEMATKGRESTNLSAGAPAYAGTVLGK